MRLGRASVTDAPGLPLCDEAPLSDGEIHYLWYFIQGSIMNPDIRERLVRAWGMCPRHTFAAFAVEATFRPNMLHGPAVLYDDLMQRALRAFEQRASVRPSRLVRTLRVTGQCLMCDMGYGPHSGALAAGDIVARGRDLSDVYQFVQATQREWAATVCGLCLEDAAAPRCRSHLLEDIRTGRGVDLSRQGELVRTTAAHVQRFSRSFRWELRGTDTPADRAALISAMGWCSGWQPWLRLAGTPEGPGQAGD